MMEQDALDEELRSLSDVPAPRLSRVRRRLEERLFGAGPRRIAQFQVLGQIGQGAMGEVLRALDPRLQREVALKLLRPELHDSAGARERLLEEARVLARLRHPNIVSVFEADFCDEGFYIAMELVDSGTLRDWLTSEPRSLEAIMDRFIGAGRGLEAAHAAGVVHRDFKPDNVLMDHAADTVKVADFGLSFSRWSSPASHAPRSVDDGAATTTCTGTVLGTPAYMAPEQWQGRADARSDQYAYCVALYEAVFGARPDAESRTDDIVVPARSRHLGRLPSRLRRALQRGLRVSPSARFKHMRSLLDQLRKVRRAHSVRHWTRAAAAAGALGVGAVGLWAADHWIEPDLPAPAAVGVERAERWLRSPESVEAADFTPDALQAIPLSRWRAVFREMSISYPSCGARRVTEVDGDTVALVEYHCEPYDLELAVAVEPNAPHRFRGVRVLAIR